MNDSCGALKSPEDSRDWVYERIVNSHGYYDEPPVEFKIVGGKNLPPRDQGKRGSCAAFAGATIKELQDACSVRLSPEFIYYHRNIKPAEGMYGRNVFQILQQIGVVPEELYPYNDDESAVTKPSRRLYDVAAKYRITNYARVYTIDGLKRALFELGPCYLSLPLYKNRPEFWIAEEGEECMCGHAVAVVGYTIDGFIIKNSWGDEWNGNGYIIFPYDKWNLHWECWVGIVQTNKSKKYKKCVLF